MKKAIEKALALLRQGQTQDAMEVLQDALVSPEASEKSTPSSLELAFDPARLPHVVIIGTKLCIDDTGWEINEHFLEVVQSAVEALWTSSDEEHVLEGVRGLLRRGVASGEIKRSNK